MSNADRQKRYRDSKRNAPRENTLVERIFMGPNVTRVTVKPERNALAIPGDPDYVERCKPAVKDMPTDELVRRLHYIKDWQRSPEHKEVLRRRQEATV